MRTEPGWLTRARLLVTEPDLPELVIVVVGLAAILIVQALA